MASADDFKGDGRTSVSIGAPDANGAAGNSYVIYGITPTKAPTTNAPTSSGSTLQPNYLLTGVALLGGVMQAVKNNFFTGTWNTLRGDKG